LHRMLMRLDRGAAARIQPRDTQKLIRALEVCIVTRQPISDLHARGREGLAGFRVTKIGLNPPRERLYDRINRRVEQMFAGSLLEETQNLLHHPHAERVKPLGALGYRQARAVLEGKLSREAAVSDTQTATRHYAKRQLTWFRREAEVIWFEGFGDDPQVQCRILEALGRSPVAAGETALASPAAAS
jgi:tRNA dimethylallyltransferase